MNVSKAVRCLLVLALTFACSGCWDYREIHQITFVTTLGVDYQNKEYVLHAQALNFSNIAQREGERPKKHKAVIGIARGDTLTQAMFNLYQSEQNFIYWGHISAIIFCKPALEQLKIEQLVDSVNRFRELRYNVWVYGTDTPIDQLLNATPYFGYSPYDSRLMKPNQTYRQFSSIKPVYLNRVVSDYFDRGKAVLIPRLSIDASSWSEGGEKLPLFKMDGMYLISSQTYSGMLTEEQMKGRRYMDRESVRMPMPVTRNGKPAALFVLNKPRVRIRHSVSGGKVFFDLRIRLAGYADEMLQDMSAASMREQVERNVEREIRDTFANGKKMNADVLDLTLPLYRYHYPTWKKYITDRIDMSRVELRQVQVDFTIKNSGKYKMRLQ